MSIDEFWNSTPYELHIITRSRHKAERQRLLFLAWHIAALTRTETMPSFDELIGEQKTPTELASDRRSNEEEFHNLVASRTRSKSESKA
jgi:hypothetical protein